MKTPPSEEDGLYDFAPDPRPTSAASSRKASGTSSATLPLSYQTRPPPVATTDEQVLKDLHLPLWFLGGGIVIEVIAAFIDKHALVPALQRVGVDLIIGTILMLAGIMLAARFRGIDLGRFWTVVLKLAAISVAPSAVVHLASPVLFIIPLGGILGWIGEFIFYFALLGMLFDLDESDTWYCVCVIFLVRLAVYFSLMGLVSKWG